MKERMNKSLYLVDNPDFEIDFYRAIIVNSPDYVEALALLGEAYVRKGLYHEGLEIDRRITELCPKDPIAHYNLACSYSLIHKRKEALASLRRSITLGYCDLAHITTDQDLVWLHDDRSFHRLIRKICKKIIRESRAPGIR
jgi:tetratricopeptide (TPR) repeat protein